MSIQDEARAEFRFTDAEWREYQAMPEQGYSHRGKLEFFVNRWLASRKPEAAPSDTDQVDRLAVVLMEAWSKAEPDSSVTKHPASYVATFADMARAVLSRSSQPVQVEVTTELRERLADEVGYPAQADDYYGPEGEEFAEGRAKGYNAAFENVLAALGGGE